MRRVPFHTPYATAPHAFPALPCRMDARCARAIARACALAWARSFTRARAAALAFARAAFGEGWGGVEAAVPCGTFGERVPGPPPGWPLPTFAGLDGGEAADPPIVIHDSGPMFPARS